MSFLREFLLFGLGFLLGIWYTSVQVLPVLYGIPRAFLGWFRKELPFRAILTYLIAPIFWTVFFAIIFLGLAAFWPAGSRHVLESGGFNFGSALGSVALLVNVLVSAKAKSSLSTEFDRFSQPYKRRA
jgi:hypothetical protein